MVGVLYLAFHASLNLISYSYALFQINLKKSRISVSDCNSSWEAGCLVDAQQGNGAILWVAHFGHGQYAHSNFLPDAQILKSKLAGGTSVFKN